MLWHSDFLCFFAKALPWFDFLLSYFPYFLISTVNNATSFHKSAKLAFKISAAYFGSVSVLQYNEFALRFALRNADVSLGGALETGPGRNLALDYSRAVWSEKITIKPALQFWLFLWRRAGSRVAISHLICFACHLCFPTKFSKQINVNSIKLYQQSIIAKLFFFIFKK